MIHKDLRKIVKALREQGFEVRATKGGHFNVFLADEYVTTLPGTPSDHRSLANGLRPAYRRGFVWPPRR